MTARILVVDDNWANVKLLEARLTSEYFDVKTADSGAEALNICRSTNFDVILLDIMMPGMDGFEVCRRLKSDPNTQHVPVIMITALDQTSDKIRGLQAGADDFLTKPVDDIALITRVRNLSRLKTLTDEMILRTSASTQLEHDAFSIFKDGEELKNSQILIVDDHDRSGERTKESLAGYDVKIQSDPQQVLFELSENKCDLLILNLNLQKTDGLRIISQIRSLEQTRHLPILTIVNPGDESRLLRALDMGINDYLQRPIDRNELFARVNTQLKRKKYTDLLQLRFEERIEMAVVDPLTGLYNRRYMESHLKKLCDDSLRSGRPMSVMITDIDYFKSVNDTHGHDVGDVVLKQFSKRIRQNTRGIDLACRMGGEEFVVIMPDTDLSESIKVGNRLRSCIASQPFRISDQLKINITSSIGIGTVESVKDTVDTILKRADQALYTAKASGRNRVVPDLSDNVCEHSAHKLNLVNNL